MAEFDHEFKVQLIGLILGVVGAYIITTKYLIPFLN